MPPKKRKAAEAAVDGEEAHVFKSQRVNGRPQAATAAAGRPRRSTGSASEVSAPTPKTKAAPKSKPSRKPVSKPAAKPVKSTTETDGPKRRGRPPKASTDAVAPESVSKAKPPSITAVKKRGRPAKSAIPATAPKEIKKAPKQGTRSSHRLSSSSTSSTNSRVSFAKTTATIPEISTKANSGKSRGRAATKSILKNGDASESVSADEDGAEALNGEAEAPNEDGQNEKELNGELSDGAFAEEVNETDTNNAPSYWLMKAEPETRMEKGVDVKFSIDDLAAAKEPQGWDGVRNHVAQKNMREMKKGDLAFFYHSNCKVPGIAGIMEIVQEHSVDESAFDENHPYYDAKSTRDNPKWSIVHVEFRRKLPQMITLAELKSFAKAGGALENMTIIKQSRLSVSRVNAEEWAFIMDLVEEENNAVDDAAPLAPAESEGQAAEPEADINPVDEELQEELQDDIREDNVMNGEGATTNSTVDEGATE